MTIPSRGMRCAKKSIKSVLPVQLACKVIPSPEVWMSVLLDHEGRAVLVIFLPSSRAHRTFSSLSIVTSVSVIVLGLECGPLAAIKSQREDHVGHRTARTEIGDGLPAPGVRNWQGGNKQRCIIVGRCMRC